MDSHAISPSPENSDYQRCIQFTETIYNSIQGRKVSMNSTSDFSFTVDIYLTSLEFIVVDKGHDVFDVFSYIALMLYHSQD